MNQGSEFSTNADGFQTVRRKPFSLKKVPLVVGRGHLTHFAGVRTEKLLHFWVGDASKNYSVDDIITHVEANMYFTPVEVK